jgi:hypothetical protein
MGLVRAFAGLKRASRLVTWVLLRVDRHRTASAGLVGITPSQSLTSYADSSPGIHRCRGLTETRFGAFLACCILPQGGQVRLFPRASLAA